jgi:transcriptional regulator with PAS, ATPase and Fis domain
MAELSCYPWPGNVRELENVVKRLIALSGGEGQLTRELLALLPSLQRRDGGGATRADGLVPTLAQVVEEAEKQYIQEVLRKTGNQKTRASEILGISRKNLWEKMKRYGLD